jgi:enoyl-CoA hydratase/carnithine racemase
MAAGDVDIRSWSLPHGSGEAPWLPVRPAARSSAAGLFSLTSGPGVGMPAAMFDLCIDDDVARLVLNRPEARNAIPVSQWPLLTAAADRAEKSRARVLLVSGQGSAFCAGADISDFAGMRDDEAAAALFRRTMREALDRIAGLPIPAIALIDGPCFGAGVALAMACDLRLAGADARFAITPAKFGISYPQEDVHRLVSLVGPGQASRLLLGAGTIDGAEAERIGLVEGFAGTRLAAVADELVAAMIDNSADSLRALKRGIRLAARGVPRDEEQDRRFDSMLGSAELADRLSALRSR